MMLDRRSAIGGMLGVIGVASLPPALRLLAQAPPHRVDIHHHFAPRPRRMMLFLILLSFECDRVLHVLPGCPGHARSVGCIGDCA